MKLTVPSLRLRSWDGDALRSQAVELLTAAASNDAFFYTIERGDDGFHFTHLTFTEDIAWHLSQFEGVQVFDDSLAYQTEARGWSVREPEPQLVNRFSHVIRDYGSARAIHELETWRHAFAPIESTDQVRALFYDGNRFIGSIAALRRGGELFDQASLERVDAQSRTIHRLLLLADRISSGEGGPLHLIVDESGRIIYADARAAGWLTKRRSELLHRLLRENRIAVIDGMAPTFAWLDDGHRRLRHVVLSPVASIRATSWYQLSGTQRDIVRLAFDGLSNVEIARIHGISASTVKYHLTQAARTLGVSGRHGLRSALNDDDCPVG